MRLGVLALVVIGCGRIGFDPSGGDDVPGDGPAPPGPVSLTLRADGQPVANVDILFHDASGTLLSTTKSNSLGQANANLPGGAMVTVIINQTDAIEAGFRLYTIVGVQPNDVIEIGDAFDRYALIGDVKVTLPGAFAGATKYQVRHGCTTTDLINPADVTIESHYLACSPNNRGAVLAVALDTDGNRLAYGLVTDIVLSASTPANVTVPAWITTYDTVNVDVRNTPAGASELFVTLEALWGTAGYDGHRDSTGDVNPSTIFALERPTGFSNAQDLVVSAKFGEGWTGVYQRTSGAGTSRMVDLANALPSLKSATILPDANGRHKLKAVANGDLSATDAGLLDVTYPNVFWSVLLPPGTVDFQFPALPTAFSMIRSNASTLFDPPGLTFVDADYITGYAAIRVKPHTFNGGEDLPANSSVRFTFANFWPFESGN